ncbi:MAG: hypothetical protein WCN92_08750 [Eubacteriales bacterium]
MLKQRFRDLTDELKRDIPLPIYIFWWIVRVLIIYAAINTTRKGDPGALQMWANVVLCFIFTIFKFFPKEKFLFSRLSFRMETIALVLNLVTTFIGSYLNLYYTAASWDIIVHFFGGMVGVYFGYEFTVAAAKRQKEFTPIVGVICGIGWCSWGAILWEIFEFTYDQLTGSNIQHWSLALAGGGKGAEFFGFTDPMRYAIFDTMSDLICGFAGAMIGGVIVFIWLSKRIKKAKVTPGQQAEAPVTKSITG